jgi:undecaprenyl-diphosphatase
MVEYLDQLDRYIFLLLNGWGHPYLDQFMIWMSDKYIWIHLYLIIIGKVWFRFGNRFWIAILLIIAAVGFSDFITSGLMKPFFERLRPCKNTDFNDQVRVVLNCRGKYGFVSSHAANTMTLALIVWSIFKNNFGRIILIWALLVGYSRIYLGVHYPGDVLGGFQVAFVLAWLAHLTIRKLL